MRLLYVVDARSPIAQNWLRAIRDLNHDVHVVSTHYSAAGSTDLEPDATIPVALSSLAHYSTHVRPTGEPRGTRTLLPRGPLRRTAQWFRHNLFPLDIVRQAPRLRRMVSSFRPDVVHAMRIPFEGILASAACASLEVPLVTSVWGNDFTLFAAMNRVISTATRRTLRRTDGLHPDTHRDLRLALDTGFCPTKPSLVAPSNGGLDLQMFRCTARPGELGALREKYGIPPNHRVVINPRGSRDYVRTDTFLNAVPWVVRRFPDVTFVAVGLRDLPSVAKRVRTLGIGNHIQLLPTVPRVELANLFTLAEISVSPAEHDGTPNTLLESMASGCFPIAGDIESLREWLVHGANGLLFDPASPEALAAAIELALGDSRLRTVAAADNRLMIMHRAEQSSVMRRAEAFYRHVVESKDSRGGS